MNWKIFYLLIILASCTTPVEKVTEATFPDGTPKIVKTYRTEGGKKILINETTYYPGGKVQLDGGYNNGQRHGTWVFYYQNGQKWSEALYNNGKEDSLKTIWFENGNIYYQGMMKQGERKGVWKFWDETGSLVKEIDYDTVNPQ